MASADLPKDSPPKGGFKTFWNNLGKIGNVKTLLIILALVVVAIIMLNTAGTKKTSTVCSASNSNYTTSLEYIKQIEAKLNDVVGGIKGAGKTKVMISISSSPELSLAKNIEEKTVSTSSGTTTTVSAEPIIVGSGSDSTPLVLKETLPEINGVIVVSEGAKDVKIKLDIILAVSTALGVNSNIVEVFAGA